MFGRLVVHSEVDLVGMVHIHQMLQGSGTIVPVNAIRVEWRPIGAHSEAPAYPVDQARAAWTIDASQPKDGGRERAAQQEAFALEHANP